MNNTKTCIACGKEFTKRAKESTKWLARKFCSRKCNLLFNGGKTRFKKGNHPWHIGLKGVKPPNEGSFRKGMTSWNKGLHIQTNNALVEWSKKHDSAFKGRRHTEATKRIIREKRAKQKNPSGKKHWNWRGGTSPLRKRIQALALYRRWRSEVFKRDDYVCKGCGQRGGRLNVDHLKPFYKILRENRIRTVKQAKRCQELWSTNNGKTLCIPCHKQTPSYLVNQHTIN